MGSPTTRRCPALALAGLAIAVAGLGYGIPEASAVRGRDVSRSAGLYEVTRTRGATVFDYDRDGWDDVLIGRHYDGFYRLHRNDRAGGFDEISRVAFPRGERGIRDPHECAAADVDRDGRTDLYCTTGGVHGTAPNPNRLWLQRSDGTFVERTKEYRVANRWGRGRLAIFLNANGDRFPDLFVGNAYPRRDGRRSPNRLFVNRGGRRFRGAREFGVDREVGAKSLQAIDFNRDGRDDIFVCGSDGIRLYQNVRHRRFRNVTRRRRAAMRCAFARLANMNRDRRPDLIRVSRSSLRVHLFANGGFRKPAYKLRRPGGKEVAVGRINRDGLTDLYYLRSGPPGDDRRDIALINRRSGHRFRRVPIPRTAAGRGEAVRPIDYDADRLTEFIVLNGHRKSRGPIRLVDFR